MNIFNSLQKYADKWSVTGQRNFSQEEKNAVVNAEVVESEYGNSVCFFMVGGGKTYIPLSNDSTLGVGESVDLDKAQLLTLSKSGENDIVRVSI